jgi:hypothetical protein
MMTTLRLSSACVVRPHKLDMADLQCLREFEESNDSRIAAAATNALLSLIGIISGQLRGTSFIGSGLMCSVICVRQAF